MNGAIHCATRNIAFSFPLQHLRRHAKQFLSQYLSALLDSFLSFRTYKKHLAKIAKC